MLDIITNQISSDLLTKFDTENSHYRSPFEWEIVGKNLVFLVAEMVIFFLVNLIFEYVLYSSIDRNESHNSILKLENVSKSYTSCTRTHDAVKNLSLNVMRGECYGLIGLNGAGKSTTFKMVTGQIKASSGNIQFNCDRIGYCSQINSLDDFISVGNHLWIYARISGYDKGEAGAVIDQLLREYSMEQYRNVPTGHLSGGNKRKLCAATSMLGAPDIILMDEPTSGMDPSTRRLVWNNIQNMVKKGKDCKSRIYDIQ